MVFLLNLELSIDYQCLILDKLGDLSQGELIIMAIADDIIIGIAGAIDMIFGFGILRCRGGNGWPMLFTILFSHY